jgi:cytochrome c-type biogenesis protein CcsB
MSEPGPARDRPAAPPRRWAASFVRAADVLGSVWFGVTLMVLLFVYGWLGSAGTAPFYEWFVRQTFEKTEMEWFAWWPLQVLVALLGLSLVLVTVRKIRPDLPNLGVWAVHLGVLVLLLGALVYFGRKLEGDVLVIRRTATLAAGGAPVELPLQAGAATVVPAGDGRSYDVQVSDLNPAYTLLTGPDAGQQTFAAQLLVQPRGADGRPAADPFVRQVLVGYPQFTEDVLPGRGRAVNALGRPLVDETLQVTLRYAPAERMFLANRAALHVRAAGSAAWAELPLRDLPRYREVVPSPDDVWTAPGEALPAPAELTLEPAAEPGGAPLPDGLRVRVTGFLPFAVLQERVEPSHAPPGGGDGGGDPPLVRASIELGDQVFTPTLLADDPRHGGTTLGDDLFDVRFRWLSDPAELARWLHPPTPTVVLRVPALSLERVVTLSELMAGPVELPGAGYTVEGLRVVPKWAVAGAGAVGTAGGRAPDAALTSMVLVRVRGPQQTFVRAVVTPQLELSRDLDESGQSHPGLLDEELEVVVRDLPWPGMTLVAGPVGLHVLMHNLAGEVRHGEARLGEPLPFFDGEAQVTFLEVAPSSRRIVKPALIPPAQRDLKAGQLYSLVQVEVSSRDAVRRGWLPYSHYAHPSRMGYHPQRLDLPGAPPLEVVYSRETVALPAPVVLEDFRLETYPGRERERDYISRVRFGAADGTWSEPHEVRSNQPTEHAGWWYFQATWDPPDPQAGYGGMSFTGLGVGNRHGVGVMLLGALLTVLGTLWAFYVKPFLLRARLRRLRAAGTGGEPADTPDERESQARPTRRRHAVFGAVLLLTLLALGAQAAAAERTIPLSVDRGFAAALDLRAFRLLAVQDEGRLKTVDSLARETVKAVNASPEARAVDPVLLYLDLAFAPEHHSAAAGIYVRKKVLVQQLVRMLQGRVPAAQRTGALADAELARIEETGFVSPAFLDHPDVRAVLAILDRDLQRTSKQVQELRLARQLANPGVLQGILRLVPPPGGDPLDAWFPPAAAANGGVPGLAPETGQRIGAAWDALARAWRGRDAGAANAALATLAETLPPVAPALYPSPERLSWEHWYYRSGKLTITWVVYLAALPFLLMTIVYGFRWARWTGLAIFGAGFALHTFSIGLRWYLAGRIPNANMFEAIVASAWFGGLLAVALELLLRRRPVRSIPALAAGTYAMTAMMVGHFLPVQLNSDIAPVMPVLDRTIWLYIHTNMVIASYALIFFAAVTALLYLVLRGGARFAAPAGRFGRLWTGPGGGGPPALLAAAGGGAGALILGRAFASGDARNAGLARTLDGATMVFLEVAFVLLWLGTILGAVWADVSWGRPWGWDPKEVFALNTWLVFLILVHVRLKVRDKALWTAALALAGCAVMLFNWIAVNFVIVGLHSYA